MSVDGGGVTSAKRIYRFQPLPPPGINNITEVSPHLRRSPLGGWDTRGVPEARVAEPWGSKLMGEVRDHIALRRYITAPTALGGGAGAHRS